MADNGPVIELTAHDMTRVWNLAIAIYDGDDEDADLRKYFVQALQIYMEFMEDLTNGGTDFETEEHLFVSEREARPEGDVVRFRARPLPTENGKGKKKKKS